MNTKTTQKQLHIKNLHRVADVTTRQSQQTEKALLESEEKFRNLFENAQDMIVLADPETGKILDINIAGCHLLGLPKEKIIGRHQSNLHPPELADKYKQLFQDHVQKGVVITEDMIVQNADGAQIPMDVSASVVKLAGKTIIQGIFRDMTKRIKMEQALRESEEKFSVAFRASPQMMTISNRKTGKYIDVNDSYVNTTGYSREEFIGHSGDEKDMWVYPEELKRMARLMQEQEKIRNEEFSLRMKSGEIRNWLCSADTINIGGESCSIAVATDITERKRIEKALVDEATRRRILIEQSSDGIVIIDINGKVYEANRRFAEMLGYSFEEVLQLSVFDWEFLLPREQLLEMLRTVDEAGDHFETQHRRKDGTTYDVEISTNGATFAGRKLIFCVCRDIKERKRMEQALRESEEKFSKAFMNSPEVIVISNIEDGTIFEANDTFLRLTGYTREEVTGKTTTELDTWARLEERAETLKILKEKGIVSNKEYQFRMKSGEIRIWLFSAEIININDKPCMLSVTIDITDRKKAEEALKQSEEKYRELINTSIDAIISIDSKMNIAIWNRGAERLFGYTEKEMLGQSIMTIFPTTLHKFIAREIINIKSNGMSKLNNKIYETSGLKKDCNTVPIEISLSTRKTEDNPIITMIIRDITIRKEAQETLRESEERYRDLFENASDFIQSCNVEGRFIYVNRAWLNALGYTEKEVLNLKFWDIIHPDYLEHCKQTLQKVMSGETVNNIETVFVAKDGRLIHVEGNINPVREEEKVVATRAIFRDINVRKEAEEKLRKIDQMKSEFLSNVSHELRTPLQSIGGFTKLILTGKVPDSTIQQEFLQIIDRETMHLGNLINGLLDMSRLEAGRFQIYKKLISVYDIFTDSIKIFHSLAREKEITLSESIPARLPKMEVDSERMRQVILNLVGNALKFSDPGTNVNVKVAIRDGELLFQVIDHGTGIREENMKHLFERFYRVEGETVRGGTGLGLYISKQIIDAHGGRIWAESKFGEGSTFSFTLPLNNEGGKKDGKENSSNRRRSGNAKAGRLLSKARGVPDNHGI
jgi:PAS domain S-box-containing protein